MKVVMTKEEIKKIIVEDIEDRMPAPKDYKWKVTQFERYDDTLEISLVDLNENIKIAGEGSDDRISGGGKDE